MKQHHRIYAIFFLFAISMGALLARLPDLQEKLGLSEGGLGLLLLTMSIGAVVGLTVMSPLIERIGARATAFLTVFGCGLVYVITPWVPSALLLAPLFFISGVLSGGLEILVNIETDRHEAALGYRIMSRGHGMWSLGFFVTAFAAAGIRQLGISIEVHMLLTYAVVIVAGIYCFSGIESAPARAADNHEAATPSFAVPTAAIIVLGLIGAAPLLVEGAGVDWSAIYMRDVFAVEPFIGGMSVTLFSLFMAIARLTMDSVVDRFGPRRVATVLLAVAGTGLVLVATALNPVVALIGFALMGIGCSSIYPLAVSAAAQRTDRPAAINVASLGQLTFVVFFLGPPVLGFVAEHWGIRISYWICVPLLVAALLAVRALSPHPTRATGIHEPATPHG